MLKKILTAICITCLAISIVGCSNNKSNDSTNSANSSTQSTDPTKNFESYDLYNVSAIGNTRVTIGNPITFNTNDKDITAQVGHGSEPVENLTYNSKDLEFYIFENEEDAKIAFEYIKTNLAGVNENTEQSYVIGFDKNAIEIKIKYFYYLNRNMIIYHLDYMSDPGSTADESTHSRLANKKLHESIINNWNQ